MDKTEVAKVQRQMADLVQKPEWAIWREYVGKQFRREIYTALRGTKNEARLAALDRAGGILLMAMGLEMETEQLTQLLNNQALDADNEAAKKVARARGAGGPQPYRDDGE